MAFIQQFQYRTECLARWGAGMLAFVISRFLAVSMVFFSINAYASQDQYQDGRFTRNDGTVVTILKHKAMPIGAHFYTFQLADGKSISTSDEDYRSVIRAGLYDFILINHGSMVEIYGYGFRGSHLPPIATQVQRFDGYTFTDIMTPGKQWLSPLIHLRGHIVGYCLATAILLIQLKFWITLYKATPSGYLWGVPKIMWVLSGLVIGGFYLRSMFFFSLSPVLIVLGAIFIIVLYQQIRKLMRGRGLLRLGDRTSA